MKILRNIGKIVGSGIFILALSIVIVAVMLTKFTEHDTMKGVAAPLIGQQIVGNLDKTTLDQAYQMFLEECKKSEEIQLSGLGGQNISIKCEDVEKTTPEGLVDVLGGALFDVIYYKKYDCSFIECLKRPGQEKLTVIISSEAHSFFKNLQNISLIICGIGLVLMLVSIETWGDRLKSVGAILISTALPVVILILFKDKILQLSQASATVIKPVIDQLFSSMLTIFIIMSIVGIVLTVSGYVLKHYRKAKVKEK